MTWILKRLLSGAPKPEYLWSRNGSDTTHWHAKKDGAWRFTDRSEACRALWAAKCWAGSGDVKLVKLRPRGTKPEKQALLDVVSAAEALLDYHGADHGDWALRQRLHNAVAAVRRTPQASPNPKGTDHG